MKKLNFGTIAVILTGLAFLTSDQLIAQSQLTRQLQQKLSSRKTSESQKTGDTAPASNPEESNLGFQAKTPKEYSDALHLAVVSKNLKAFNSLVSWNTIADTATSSLSGKSIEEYKQRLQKDVQSRNSLGARIINSVDKGGSYDFLQLRKIENRVVAVFRMLLPGGKGVNYHEYVLAKNQAGMIVASDIYVYLAGENLSKSIRRNLITALPQTDSKTLTGLTTTDKLLSDHLNTIEKLNEALAKDDAKAARENILKLPKELRKDTAIQVMTLNTYKKSKSFQTVLEGIRKVSPDDVFMDMVSIDILVRQKEYEKAITSIERINERVGGDPYLKILHGRMLLNLGEKEPGRQMIREAVSEDDGILTGHWNLVSFALAEKDHEETLRLLKNIHSRFKIKFKDLREIASYKNFVKSGEFKEWTKFLESNEVIAPTSEPAKPSTANASTRRTNNK